MRLVKIEENNMIEVENITQKDVESFYNQYKYNSDLIVKLERKLINESFSYERWQKMLTQQSKLTRSLFKQNNELLENYSTSVIKSPRLLSKEALRSYLLYISFFIFENRVDSAVTIDLLNAFFKSECCSNPQDKFEAYLSAEICTSTLNHEFNNPNMEVFNKVSQAFHNMENISNIYHKTQFIICRIMHILDLSLQEKPDLKNLIEQIEQLSFDISSIQDQNLLSNMWGEDKDYEMHKKIIIRYIKFNFLFAAYQSDFSTLNLTAENNTLSTFILYLKDEFETENKEGKQNCLIFAIYYKFLYKSGEISKNEYKEKLEHHYFKLLNENITEYEYPENILLDDSEPNCFVFASVLDTVKIFSNSFSFVFFFMEDLLMVTESPDIKKDIIKNTVDYFIHMPFSEKGTLIDKFILPLMINIMNSMESIDEILNFLQILFVRRQVSTAMHSTMVSKLINICTKYMIESNPEFFSCISSDKEEIFSFVTQAGLCHDIGKLYCSDAINLHFRKITNNEFETIKHHPSKGAFIAKQIPALSQFSDIIEGHHKFYDGTSGYPSKFDNTKSKYRNIIDLITICDCIDAATDVLGRNYAKGKVFDEVLAELENQSGTRYNPEMVSFISRNEDLKNELRHMTSEGRKEVYYSTYSQYVEPHTDFSFEDEKLIIPVSEDNIPQIIEFYSSCMKCDKSQCEDLVKNLISPRNFQGFLLSNRKGRIFGIICGRIFPKINNTNFKNNTFVMDDFRILPEYRREGLGTDFLAEVEDRLKEEEIEKIVLTVVKDLKSESFFWINGFLGTDEYQMQKII